MPEKRITQDTSAMARNLSWFSESEKRPAADKAENKMPAASRKQLKKVVIRKAPV